jgi:hypothetical protein
MALFFVVVSFAVGIFLGYRCVNRKLIGDIAFWKQMSDKHLLLYELSVKWIEVRQQNRTIWEYLQNQGCERIGIYGMSYLGQRLFEELKGSGLEVVCGLDRRADDIHIQGLWVISPDDLPKNMDVDTIVVTSFMQYEKIYCSLLERMGKEVRILSLESILHDL